MCLARLARDQIHVLLERVRDRKTRKTRKKKHLSRRHIPQFHLGVEKQACRSQRRRRHENVFSFLFCIFVSALADLLRLVIISKLRLIITRESMAGLRGTNQSYQNRRRTLLCSPDSCDGDDALFSRQFKLRDCFFATSDLKK